MDELVREDGAVIRYVRHAARGPARARVLLVHPLAMDHSAWAGVVARLPDDIDAVAIDVRGHGRSTKGASTLGLDTATADFAALFAALGWRSAVVAGCSMGGCISIAFAQRYPELTAGLVLVDTTAFYGEDAPVKWGERAAKAEHEGFAALLPFQRGRWFTEGFLAAHPEQVERCVEVFIANDIVTYKAACAMLAGADLRAGLKDIAVPTAVLVGEDDYATPPAMAQVLNDGISGASLRILPHMRHFTVVEAPGEIAGAIADVAARVASRETVGAGA